MDSTESHSPSDRMALVVLLRVAVWVQVCFVGIIAFGSGLLAREAETFLVRVRSPESGDAMLPPLPRLFFGVMPNTFPGILILALLSAALCFVVLHLWLRGARSPISGLAKCHVLAVLLGGLFGVWLLLLCLCTLLPLTPWP